MIKTRKKAKKRDSYKTVTISKNIIINIKISYKEKR